MAYLPISYMYSLTLSLLDGSFIILLCLTPLNDFTCRRRVSGWERVSSTDYECLSLSRLFQFVFRNFWLDLCARHYRAICYQQRKVKDIHNWREGKEKLWTEATPGNNLEYTVPAFLQLVLGIIKVFVPKKGYTINSAKKIYPVSS